MRDNGDTTFLQPAHISGLENYPIGAAATDDAVTLIPNSSIQFLISGVARDTAGAVGRRFFEDNSAADASDGPVLHTVSLDDDGSFHHPVTHKLADARLTYAIDGSSALDAFLGRWVPIPMMRAVAGKNDEGVLLDEGPSNWARVHITRDPDESATGMSHRVVLALDTTCCAKPRGRPRTLAAPTLDDAQNGGLFSFSDDEADIAWFVTEAWVDDWVRELYGEHINKKAAEAADSDSAPPTPLEYLGHYLTLLAVLKEGQVLPDIRLKALGRSPAEADHVGVDLVLDIGNSRTCAIVCETGKNASLAEAANSSMLTLRDLDQPWRTHSGLFSSRIEFSRASFGKESLSRWSGRTNAFFWPSLVRVGAEAQRLVAASYTTTDMTGLSGPMRYLWDDRAGEQPWRFARTAENASRRGALVSGPLLSFVSESGDLLKDEGRAGSTTKPRFSRSSLLTFTGNELMLQTIIAINAPEYRAQKINPDLPRRLERILLTVPAGLHPRERQIVVSRLQAAVRLTWNGLGWNALPGAPPLPTVSLVDDNATNAQTAYLHNEIKYKFRGKPWEYFDLMGKARHGHRSARAIRVASLDIGGGTTGLCVANYELQQTNGVSRSILAVDGFRCGGDDILKRIAERHLMPSIERSLADCKLGKANRFLEDILGGTANGRPSWISEFGRRFAAEFAMPVALALLNESREARASGDDVMVKRSFRHLLEGSEHLAKAVIEEFDELAADEGADGFSLLDGALDLRHRDLKQTISAVLDPVLGNAVRIIEAFDCDLVLLSGWTTCLPPVLDALLGGLATQPNRVISMHGLRVHSWYPHLDDGGLKVKDAKSAAAVGAMITTRPLDAAQFSITTAPSGPECRRLFVGRMSAEGILRNDAMMFVFDDANTPGVGNGASDMQCTVKVELPAILGMRRLALERWPASPAFVIDLSDVNEVDRPKMPVEVTIERFYPEPGQAEELRILKARDGHGNSLPPSDLALRLQTLSTSDGHWFDTGAIVIA